LGVRICQLHAGFEAGLQSDLGTLGGQIALQGCGDKLSCSHAANCLPKKAFPGYPSLL
jgi:hypothetical protein